MGNMQVQDISGNQLNNKLMGIIKSSNQIVVLINVELKNPTRHNAFVAFIQVESNDVKVYQLRVIDPLLQKYQDYSQTVIGNFDLKEFMTHLLINSQTESSFIVYGSSKLYIGNISIENEGLDYIDLQPVHESLYYNKISKVEFSVLNPNYLIVLSHNNKLSFIDTHDMNQQEQVYDLDKELLLTCQHDKVLSKSYKSKRIVSFTQSQSQNAIGIQAFNIMFMSEEGEIFQMCPVFPKEIILTSEIFSDLTIYLENKRDEQQDINNHNSTNEIDIFLRILYEGIEQQQYSSQNVCISLKDDKFSKQLSQLKPLLYGPLNIQDFQKQLNNDEKNKIIFTELIMIQELPYAFVRVSNYGIELIISFYQPEMIFKQQQQQQDFNILNDMLKLMCIGEIEFPQQAQVQINERINFVHQDSLDSNVLYIQSQNSLFKVDMSFLQILQEKFLNDEVIHQGDFQRRLQQQLLIDSDLTANKTMGQYEMLGNIQLYVGVNSQKNKDIVLNLHASMLLDTDQVLSKLDRAVKEAETIVLYENQIAKIEPIPFMADIKIPDFQFDQTKMNDQAYVMQCLSKFKDFMLSDYIGQFEDFDDIIDEKVVNLNKLKEHYLKASKMAQHEKLKIDEQKQKLDIVLQQVQSNNDQIKKKVEQVQRKLNGLRAVSNDEFVIQFFVDKLEHQAKEARIKLDRAKQTMDEKNKQDNDVLELVKNVKKFESQQEVQDFIMKTRLDLDNLKRKIDNIQQRK